MKKKIKVKVLEGTPFLICEQDEIGTGSFGRVVRAYKKDEPSRELVAKIIPLTPENKDTILSEIKILKQVPYHDNLANCLKLQVSSEHNFYLIMEYCNGGSFEVYMKSNINCSQQLIWRFLREFARGYRVLYDAHLVHRDIKPENILLHNGRFKIADFGFSRRVDHHSLTQNLSLKGTPLYIAPELQTHSAGNSKIDVFSLGVVLYRFAYNGAHPFHDDSNKYQTLDDYYQHVKVTQLKFPKFPPRSPELVSLIVRMLEKDPEVRIGWKEIFQHSQIRNRKEPELVAPTEQFNQLRQSLLQIERSSAQLEMISEPFDHRTEIGAEMDRLIEFTQFIPKFEVRGLEIYIIRSNVIIEIIKHLNGLLKSMQNQKKLKLDKILRQIITEGLVYSLNSISRMINLLQSYRVQTQHEAFDRLQQRLFRDKQAVESELGHQSGSHEYQHLRYETLLYDYLTQYTELPKPSKQLLKIPTGLMIDLYDGLLKLDSIIKISPEGKIEVVEIELEDAELDKIDHQNLGTYQRYLEDANEITLDQVDKGLRSMGLIII